MLLCCRERGSELVLHVYFLIKSGYLSNILKLKGIDNTIVSPAKPYSTAPVTFRYALTSTVSMSDPSWHDITELCRNAVQELSDTNPMVTIPDFSLFDSMSAVELMDPKVDQCCGLVGSADVKQLLQYRTPTDTDGRGLQLTTVVKLCQSILVQEAAFFDGASLMESISQCIFSWPTSWPSLELHDSSNSSSSGSTDNNEREGENQKDSGGLQGGGGGGGRGGGRGVAEASIATYCKTMLRTCVHYFEAVMAADIFEDEDFQHAYRNKLPSESDLTDADTLILLEQTCERLRADSGGGMYNSKSDNTDQAVIMHEYLLHVLQFKKAFHALLTETCNFICATMRENGNKLKRLQGNGGEARPSPYTPEKLKTMTIEMETICTRVRLLAKDVLVTIQVIQSMHKSHGESVLRSDVCQAKDEPDLLFAYSETVVKLEQISPIRRITPKPFLESLSFFGTMCEDLILVCDVTEDLVSPLVDHVNNNNSAPYATPGYLTVENVLLTSIDFSNKKPHLIARSMYYAILHIFAVNHGIKDSLSASMNFNGIPRMLVSHELVQERWLGAVPVIAVWETLKGCCVCRSKLLGRMEAIQLVHWGTVARDAAFVDHALKSEYRLSTDWASWWVMSIVVTVMDFNMSLMAEMDLIQPCEMDAFYWYWDYICSMGVHAAITLSQKKCELDYQLFKSTELVIQELKVDIEQRKILLCEAMSVFDSARALAAAASLEEIEHSAVTNDSTKNNKKNRKKNGKGQSSSPAAADSQPKHSKLDKAHVSTSSSINSSANSQAAAEDLIVAEAGLNAAQAAVSDASQALEAEKVNLEGHRQAFELNHRKSTDFIVSPHILFLQARGTLCKALFQFSVFCVSTGLVEKVETQYSSFATRFNRRFRSFDVIPTPSAKTHNDFLDALRSGTGISTNITDPKCSAESLSMMDIYDSADKGALLLEIGATLEKAKQILQKLRKLYNPKPSPNDSDRQNVDGYAYAKTFTTHFHINQVLGSALLLSKVSLANSLSTKKVQSLLPMIVPTGSSSPATTNVVSSPSSEKKYRLNISWMYCSTYPTLTIDVCE